MNSFQVIAVIAAAVAFAVWYFWPNISAASTRSRTTHTQVTDITPPADATITVSQAIAAEMLLEKFKAQGGTDLGSKLVADGLKHLAAAEKTH